MIPIMVFGAYEYQELVHTLGKSLWEYKAVLVKEEKNRWDILTLKRQARISSFLLVR